MRLYFLHVFAGVDLLLKIENPTVFAPRFSPLFTDYFPMCMQFSLKKIIPKKKRKKRREISLNGEDNSTIIA